MSDSIRAALERLDETADPDGPVPAWVWVDSYCAARAALAGQQGEGPSDEELTQFLFDNFRGPIEFICDAEEEAHVMIRNHIKFARAVLARWGHQPTPPAEGEVAELAAKLRRIAPHNPLGTADPTITRAAELLQQQQAKIESLEQQLETERMRVVACGIIAMSDTPFSAAKNRNYHPDYWSASADDIARQIDELMRLRAQQTPVPEEAANPWKDALIDALVCACLLNEENQSDPRRALHDLISWEVQLARDPLITPPVHPTTVPVEEEPWKREGWCDESGLCWFGWATEPYLPPSACWSFCKPSERECCPVSLPAHALPLPQGEVEG